MNNGDQPERDQVGRAVLVVDALEDLLVAGLAAERLHRADAADRLDEVHDDQRDRLAGPPVAPADDLRNQRVSQQQERDAAQRDQAQRRRRGRAA